MQSNILKPFRSKIDTLSSFEKAVIVEKATERPYTGTLLQNDDKGVYRCKLCGTELYRSNDKFDSHCGWPSFDDEIDGAIRRIPDLDGRRTEIVCAECGGHLGHVFEGEGMTPKDVRHCVNSVSLTFEKSNTNTPDKAVNKYARAYFAGGCFWGVEYYMQQMDGVKEVISGFMGGHVKNPDYYDVVKGNTGHLETVEVIYDPSVVDYEALVKKFFEIHDPEQTNGQGPDIGSQYLSAVFVSNENEANVVADLIKKLESNGYRIATQVLPKKEFYPAEEGHQDYYDKKGTLPYCHGFVPRFDENKK